MKRPRHNGADRGVDELGRRRVLGVSIKVSGAEVH
jgi:hypothetical protein